MSIRITFSHIVLIMLMINFDFLLTFNLVHSWVFLVCFFNVLTDLKLIPQRRPTTGQIFFWGLFFFFLIHLLIFLGRTFSVRV